jgi:RNA polymerase sigma-70 factor (ECF subfamily)
MPERMATAGIDLIRRMAGGDREAFASFYDAYAPLAWGLLRRMLPDGDDATEVLQEVFWELWRAAGDYDPARGTPEAWVTVRTRSRGIDRVRSLRRRDDMFTSASPDMPINMADERAENPSVQVEARDTVQGVLGELPENQREVIELAYLAGYTQSEIAERLQQPLGTVKTRMRLGMERLRTLAGGRP